VPNVTAIDCKQADVYGQLQAKGGMSFTVQEARAAFVVCHPLHVGGDNKIFPSSSACLKQRADETPAT
jgi:hypothetical protein